VPGEMIILRLLNEPSAKIGNTFWELVTEVEGTKTRSHIWTCFFRRSYSFVGIRNGEQILGHSVAVERINVRWIKSTDTNTHGSSCTPSKPNKECHAISNDFTSWDLVFEVTV
jgi:hypothetical protein